MCMLLKFHYAKFGVLNLCLSKVIEEKPLGGRLDPPMVLEGLSCYEERLKREKTLPKH